MSVTHFHVRWFDSLRASSLFLNRQRGQGWCLFIFSSEPPRPLFIVWSVRQQKQSQNTFHSLLGGHTNTICGEYFYVNSKQTGCIWLTQKYKQWWDPKCHSEYQVCETPPSSVLPNPTPPPHPLPLLESSGAGLTRAVLQLAALVCAQEHKACQWRTAVCQPFRAEGDGGIGVGRPASKRDSSNQTTRNDAQSCVLWGAHGDSFSFFLCFCFLVCFRFTCSCRKRTRDRLTSPLKSLFQERGHELACSQPHTYCKWVQASRSVCDQLRVSGWNELLCKTNWGDAHGIMRQAAGQSARTHACIRAH